MRELKYLSERKVYEYFSTAAAIQISGRRPLRLKWIDVNKGDKKDMLLRSRLVCTEVAQSIEVLSGVWDTVAHHV